MRNWPAMVTLSLVAVLTPSAAVLSQNNGQAPGESSAQKTQNPVATPDLSGVWNVASGVYEFASFGKEDPPMTPWGQAQLGAAKPSQGPHGVKLSETNDRVYKCSPPGLPYIYIQLFPMQIIQSPKEIIELFEYDHTCATSSRMGANIPLLRRLLTMVTPSATGKTTRWSWIRSDLTERLGSIAWAIRKAPRCTSSSASAAWTKIRCRSTSLLTTPKAI